jgi:flavin reductase (DIM6/NTAB) family NADH-FMN oxidoreductase RutF
MTELKPKQGIKLISPRLTVLVTTVSRDGKVNAAPYSWIYPLSFDPPLVGVGIGGKHKNTYKNIIETGEFVLNIVSEEFGQEAVDCEHTHSLKEAGLEETESKVVRSPAAGEARAVLECKLIEMIEVKKSDHLIAVGVIVAARCPLKEGLPDLDAVKPLLHFTGERFRSAGREIVLKRKNY